MLHMIAPKMLDRLPLGLRPEFDRTVLDYTRRFPEAGPGVYDYRDWNRLFHAYDLVVGESVLDIGPGNGAFLHILANSGRFSRICGVDIRAHSQLLLPGDAQFRIQSVTSLDFPERSFDTVLCMEVLEHLEVSELALALAQIRRVRNKRLICTLPYKEPFPWYGHDRPGGHRQAFDDGKLMRLFPHALASLIPRHQTPWIMIVEDEPLPGFEFRILSLEQLKQTL